jgi:hypothetical protein
MTTQDGIKFYSLPQAARFARDLYAEGYSVTVDICYSQREAIVYFEAPGQGAPATIIVYEC